MTTEQPRRVTLVILAGGRATRVGGQRKALLSVGGKRILERILDVLAPLSDECAALVDTPDLPELARLRYIVDPQAHAGPLAALAYGLPLVSGDTCMLVAGDMPFLSRAAFEHLLSLGGDAALPFVDGHFEPMHSVFTRQALLAAIKRAQSAGEHRLFKVIETLNPRILDKAALRAIDPSLHTLFNVNTPDDFARAEDIAGTTT
jgi:molybdopterin-guanine dinucleotide biosynthesis protein A